MEAIQNPVHVRQLYLFLLPTVHEAQENILRNLEVVREIGDESLSEQDIRVFFRDVSLYEFGGSISFCLGGLSAMDGSRAYVSEMLMLKTGFSGFQRTLEHEYMHNMSRWIDPNDIFRISPSKNPNLRSIDDTDALIEAGDFYEERVYGKLVAAPSPFCLTLP